jgi:transcriptional antiterminator NusG
MQDLDPEEQFEQEPVESGESETPAEEPVASESPTAPAEAVESGQPETSAEEPAASEPQASEEDSGTAESEQAEVPTEDVVPGEPQTTGMEPGTEADAEAAPGGPAWYVIHCYSGYENKVRHNLEQRIETMGMKDQVFDVVVPTQEEIEVRDGKRRTVERHIFPGYVLVNMLLSEESWFVVRNTPGVTGFVGMGNMPTPLRQEEVAQILTRMEAESPTVKVTFKVGERVRIVDGPFNDFRGVVSEIDMERTKVRVMVSFFGRETPVELDFLQVEKA